MPVAFVLTWPGPGAEALALLRPLQTTTSENQIAAPPPPAPSASRLMDHRKQESPSSARSGSAASSGKHGKGGKGGGGGGGGAGGKKPIKVVYISNPMRVKTSAAGFRALVQELTGRHADPSKYSTDGFDDDDDRDGAAQELSPEGSAAASTPDAGPAHAGSVAARDQPDFAAAAAAGEGEEDDGDDEEDIFRSQLLDNDYSVLSSPTLLYDYPHSNKV